MTENEKKKVIFDLSSRLMYKPKLDFYCSADNKHYVCTLLGIEPESEKPIIAKVDIGSFKLGQDNIKPYLRPMASMTDEEKQELSKMIEPEPEIMHYDCYEWNGASQIRGGIFQISIYEMRNVVKFYIEHYLDYNELIEQGLAIEAPADMYEF